MSQCTWGVLRSLLVPRRRQQVASGVSPRKTFSGWKWRLTLHLCLMFCLLGPTINAKEQINKVGPVKVTTSLTPDDPLIGDEVVFEIKVEPVANVEVLMPEFGEALDRYDILDFVPKQKINDDGSSVYIQRYTLQPHLSGEQSIPPILVEFVDNRPGQKATPDDFDAYEILTDRLDFTVTSVLPSDASSDLKPPLGELQPRRPMSAWNWLVVSVLALVFISALAAGVLAVSSWRKRKSRRSAYELARQWLDHELSKPTPITDEQIDLFFVSISKVVRTYLENRFDLRAPDLTTEEFLELAGTSSDLSREHQSLLRDFLKQADLVKFAGVKASAEEISRAASLASQFLEETRENSPVIEVDQSEHADVEERVGV